MVFLALVCMICCVQTANIMHFDAHSFLVYALNANSLVNPGKLDHINKAILAHQPHAFVILETKTNQHHGNKLPTNKYNIFKEV